MVAVVVVVIDGPPNNHLGLREHHNQRVGLQPADPRRHDQVGRPEQLQPLLLQGQRRERLEPWARRPHQPSRHTLGRRHQRRAMQVHACMCVCARACARVRVCACMHVCVRACVCVHVRLRLGVSGRGGRAAPGPVSSRKAFQSLSRARYCWKTSGPGAAPLCWAVVRRRV